MIEAIGSLWPLALILALTLCVILFRNEIKGTLNRLTELRLRRGETELSSAYGQLEDQSADTDSQQQESRGSPEEPSATTETDSVESRPSDEHLGEMVDAFIKDNDIGRGEQLFEELQNKEEEGEQKLKNEATYLYLRYSTGDTSAIEKLLQLLERVKSTPQVLPVVHNIMGMVYEKSEEFMKASEYYEHAAEVAQMDSERADYKVSAARSKFLSGETYRAREDLKKEIGKSEAPIVMARLYEGIADLYDRMGNSELKAVILEKAIECSPNDKHLRFDAAYAYSGANAEHLALLHYLKATEFDPDYSSALNNAGVVYGQLGMPIRQIECYKRAAGNNNTLASANIAYQYMGAGFVKEARDVLNEAKQKEYVHPNVNIAFSTLEEAQQAEEDREKQSLDEARVRRRHLITFAEAHLDRSTRISLSNNQWRLTDGTDVSVTENGSVLEFRWEKRENNYLIKAQLEHRSLIALEYKCVNSYSFDLADNGCAYITEDSKYIAFMMIKDSKHSFLTLERMG